MHSVPVSDFNTALGQGWVRGRGDEGQGPQPGPEPDEQPDSIGTTSKEGRLVCERCHLPIASHADKIEIGGKFEHRGANPHGFRFRFGCFAAAAGCVQSGEPSTFYSWFPGYSWQVSNCGQCGVHLGWLFRSDSGHFHALILDALREEPES